MSDGQSQSAMREWRRLISAPRLWVVLGSVMAILALAGPFETQQLLGLPGRVAYWGAIVGLTYAWGLWVHIALSRQLSQRGTALRMSVLTLATSAGVAAVVIGLNLVVFAYMPWGEEGLTFMATLVGITGIVVLGMDILDEPKARPSAAVPSSRQSANPGPSPTLLDRVPLEKRGPLVALSVEDHYTRVRTTKGETLLLMRLTDAIRETGGTQGARVHRSHWAAFAQVQSVRRSGDRALLTMTDGSEIPVSRANVPVLKEAGLLPR